MKAIRFYRYGGPEVLEFTEQEIPAPGAGQALVRIHAASVNPLDWHIMRASPAFARLSQGLLKPKSPKLGADLAGVVEAVGPGVSEFQVGDRVFGDVSDLGLGSFAEYAVVDVKSIVAIPQGVSFAEAAAVPVAGYTALQGLRHGKIATGEKVLINGASGGIGTYAVQIAKAYGCHVTGVCSTRNLELVKSIGADEALDYTAKGFALGSKQYNLILDTIGNLGAGQMKDALLPGGRGVTVGFTTMGAMIALLASGAWISRSKQYTIGMMGTAQSQQTDLATLAEMLSDGRVRSVIDRTYTFAQIGDAIAYVETKRARGKVIVEMATDAL